MIIDDKKKWFSSFTFNEFAVQGHRSFHSADWRRIAGGPAMDDLIRTKWKDRQLVAANGTAETN